MDLSGGSALIVTTSHASLGETGKNTGVWASEMTVPYYAFAEDDGSSAGRGPGGHVSSGFREGGDGSLERDEIEP